MSIIVDGYAAGGIMPVRFATQGGGGRNVSPGVHWDAVPGAKSYALFFWDKHPVARGWVHWLVTDIPAEVTAIPEGASRTGRMPAGSLELTTSWGRTGYDGPQPPRGTGPHEYVMTLYALDTERLGLPPTADAAAFKKATKNRVLLETGHTGFFGA